jgi:hypothetical protein
MFNNKPAIINWDLADEDSYIDPQERESGNFEYDE